MKLELQTNILGNFELLPNVALSILSPKCNCVFKGSDLAEDSYIMYAALPRDTADVTLCILLKWENHLRQSLTWQSIKTQKRRGKKTKQNLGPILWDSETFSNSEALCWVKNMKLIWIIMNAEIAHWQLQKYILFCKKRGISERSYFFKFISLKCRWFTRLC